MRPADFRRSRVELHPEPQEKDLKFFAGHCPAPVVCSTYRLCALCFVTVGGKTREGKATYVKARSSR